ncbi:phosphatase PAP2 family protein [Erythrobacter sp.]|jgi:hypothetical protein|uniref:phosphatase PAP2 family protein n=1 Tax=Erythrobacter sp. TaxID=1042 RepID=UPI002EA5AF46|nr:phosphatase PAP2 family protein [Erythrobacter sp.]
MATVLTTKFGRSLARGLSEGFAAPLVVIAVFAVMVARGIWLLPEGYDGTGGMTTTFLFFIGVWAIAMAARCAEPTSKLAAGVVTFCLFSLLSMIAALAAAANAIGGGEYIDPELVRIDALLFPFYDWQAVALSLPRFETLYWAMNKVYNSLEWQPVVFILAAAWLGQVRDMGAFITAWGLGLLACIAPFHWFPALSPVPYYGIGRADLPDHMTDLPWRFLPVMEGMRDGSIRAIETQCLTGMVTVPSFHACAATILAWAFWRYPLLRWPFLSLNIGMALAAVPIGSHYIIDIVAGIAVGLLAAYSATLLGRLPLEKRRSVARASAALEPA